MVDKISAPFIVMASAQWVSVKAFTGLGLHGSNFEVSPQRVRIEIIIKLKCRHSDKTEIALTSFRKRLPYMVYALFYQDWPRIGQAQTNLIKNTDFTYASTAKYPNCKELLGLRQSTVS